MLRFNQFLIVALVCLCLVACSDRSQYAHYFRHPNKLKQTIDQCQNLGNKASQQTRCIDAFIAATVINHFLTLQRQHGQQFFLAKQQLQKLQYQLQKKSDDVTLQKRIVQQEQKLQPLFASMMTLVQEDFAKLIMQAESGLSVLKQKKQQLNTLLKKTVNNSAQASKVKIRVHAVNKQLDLQQRLIKAMLVFVGLSEAR